ncbi:MAG TPA: hypothetical protein DEF61_04025 [Firmicutes bacterium]|nr:hypothetical protein [Bacillota bacterium]
MKKDKKASMPSLSTCIEKFSQEDVIAVMEKEYQAAPARLIPTSLIDDTRFIKDVVLSSDTINSFASGLKEKGFYNPLIVRPNGERFELILGRKRFFGAKKAGILSLPCVVNDVGDEEMLLMLLADTRDNRSSNVLEMALVCNALSSMFGYTQKTLAELSHFSRSQITNILRILSLPDNAKNDICLGKLSYGQARTLTSLKGRQLEYAYKKIVDSNMSVRESEQLVRSILKREDLHSDEVMINVSGLVSFSIKNKSVSFAFNSINERDRFLNNLKNNYKN